MKKLTFLLLVIVICLFHNGYAQSEVLTLWPNGVPGSIQSETYNESSDSKDNWTKASKVTNPRIDCYLADEAINTGTAVVVCPGGGYSVLAIGHEGRDIALWFNKMGISAFVLKYRLPSDEIMVDKSVGPLQDVQEAIRTVRRNAVKWKINPEKIGVMGFSAGGHLASTASTHFNEKVYTPIDTTSARPDFSILIYPVVTMDTAFTHKGSRVNLIGENPTEEQVKRFSNELQVNAQTPPAFLVHSLDDRVVPVQNSINYALNMKANKVACELHIYPYGGHGYGLGRSERTESTWPEACKKWMIVEGFLPPI